MQAAAAAVCAAAAGTGSVDWAYGTEGAESAVGDNHYKACWIGLTDSGGADAENRWRCVYPPSLRLPPKSVKLQPPPGGRGGGGSCGPGAVGLWPMLHSHAGCDGSAACACALPAHGRCVLAAPPRGSWTDGSTPDYTHWWAGLADGGGLMSR